MWYIEVSATAYNRIFDPNEEVALSSTWGADSRIDMAVGTKIIDVINQDKLLTNAAIKGEVLKKGNDRQKWHNRCKGNRFDDRN